MTTTTTKDYYLQLVAQKIWSLSLQNQRSYDNFNDLANLSRREGKDKTYFYGLGLWPGQNLGNGNNRIMHY